MAYEDNFYSPQNIIGITGKIGGNPTVYFQSGNSFGHITQFHDVAENVGRQTKHTHPEYSIGNEIIDGKETCVEKIGDRVFHRSRNRFVLVGELNAAHTATLAFAISKFPKRKAINGMSRNAIRALIYGADIGTEKVSALLDFFEPAV